MKLRYAFTTALCVGLSLAFAASAAGGSPPGQEVTIGCSVKSSNDGCEGHAACPPGTTIRSARVACNLEHGPVTDEQLQAIQPGYIEVVRPSDHVEEGTCRLARNHVDRGRAPIVNVAGLTAVSIGCQEHDQNGGDCQIRGSLYCE